jgi:hypothetical protein
VVTFAAAVLLTAALAPVGASAAGSSSSGAAASSSSSLTGLPVPTVQSTGSTSTATSTGPITVPTPKATSSGGITGTEEAGIFVAAILVIAGIAWVIRSDARSHTPAGEIADIDRPKGTVAPIEHRLKRSRAKAKRARRARRAGR